MGDTGGLELGVTLRALRRRADLSQRELADLAGVPKSTVSRIESGQVTDPRLRTLERLVRAAGAAIAVSGDVEPAPSEGLRDRGDRNYPAHLDVRPVEQLTDWAGAWWAHWHRLPRRAWPLEPPEYTYDLSRTRRAHRRHREWVRRGLRVRRVGDRGTGVGEVWRWMAETPDGEPVGELRAVLRAAHPEEQPGREAVLEGVVVARGLRGLGIGRRLVGEFVAEVERSGVGIARAFVGAGMPAMFLRRCGFREDSWRMVALVVGRHPSWASDEAGPAGAVPTG
jgi:transcriptional regulator with XRE-family HTH domain